MPFNFSQIQSRIVKYGSASLHRELLVLAGSLQWQETTLNNLLFSQRDDVLWVSDKTNNNFPFIDVNKTSAWLGKEKKAVIFDANNSFNADAFALVNGIVVGGGIFILLLPDKSTWFDSHHSPFFRRLISFVSKNKNTYVVTPKNDKDIIFNALPHVKNKEKSPPPFLTLEQENVVNQICTEISSGQNNPIVLLADRGRGKSAALGIAVARLIKSGIKKIAVTAPRLSTTDIIFEHIGNSCDSAVVSRGCITIADAEVQFYAPDQLTQENIKADILFIDEAAAIPVPILTSFLQRYKTCVYTTTVHGYEGTGRGFSLRFFNLLNKNYNGWLKLEMQTPIRWAENDPLEKWMFDLLCLDAEVTNSEELVECKSKSVIHKKINKEQLDNDTLKQVFSLLVLAHYRTRPNDLKNMLDDDNISIYISEYNEQIIAVALVIQEGGFSKSLSTQIYRGERRPKGHLLAQALTYHCGIENAATLDYSRIMRVAVHPTLQSQGIGTNLIKFVVNSEKNLGRDAIGSSFGMNKQLLDFWSQSQFEIVRIGFTREQTSGEHAAIILRAFTEKGRRIQQLAKEQFYNKINFWFEDVLNDISIEMKNIFKSEEENLELNKFEKKDLDSFINYSRNYELCISALVKVVRLHKEQIESCDFPENFRIILLEKIYNKKSWRDVTLEMDLNGKKETRKIFKQAITALKI